MNKKYFKLKSYKNFLSYHLKDKYKKSYAQCGEDIIIDAFLTGHGISKPTYIDVGTYHPILNNNTYYFYKKGGHGILVEPDADFFRVIKRTRTRDVCINAGVGPEEKAAADFYLMSSNNLNTFLKSEAEKNVAEENYGKQAIKKIVQIPLVTIDNLIDKHLKHAPDILSIDAEGYDFEIIKSINFNKHRPKVICTETLRYGKGGKLGKDNDVVEFLKTRGYSVYADTFVNTIFVESSLMTE